MLQSEHYGLKMLRNRLNLWLFGRVVFFDNYLFMQLIFNQPIHY